MRRGGYTFIELIAAIALIAIVFVPMMEMFHQGLVNMREAGVRRTAIDLAGEELALLEMADLTVEQMAREGSRSRPVQVIDNSPWAVRWEFRFVDHQPPLEIRIKVYRQGRTEKPEFELVTFKAETVR